MENKRRNYIERNARINRKSVMRYLFKKKEVYGNNIEKILL